MKNLGAKFVAVFLWWVWFSMLMSAFANTVTISTDFNTATQYLKKIIVQDDAANDKIVLDGNSSTAISVNWNIESNGYIFANQFCKYGTTGCVDMYTDVLDKFSAMERKIETKMLKLTDHFDYNSIYNWMDCDVDREWELIYGYSDDNVDDWYLYLCKRVPNTPSPHYEWRQLNIE